MTSNTKDTRSTTESHPERLFRIDEPLHRPPDGYHLAEADGWDSYAVDPDEIDDN